MRLYCGACNAVHTYPPAQVERIVYALVALETDARLTHAQDRSGAAQCEPDGILSGDYAGHLEAEQPCLETVAALASDSECYLEFVEQSYACARREAVA